MAPRKSALPHLTPAEVNQLVPLLRSTGFQPRQLRCLLRDLAPQDVQEVRRMLEPPRAGQGYRSNDGNDESTESVLGPTKHTPPRLSSSEIKQLVPLLRSTGFREPQLRRLLQKLEPDDVLEARRMLEPAGIERRNESSDDKSLDESNSKSKVPSRRKPAPVSKAKASLNRKLKPDPQLQPELEPESERKRKRRDRHRYKTEDHVAKKQKHTLAIEVEDTAQSTAGKIPADGVAQLWKGSYIRFASPVEDVENQSTVDSHADGDAAPSGHGSYGHFVSPDEENDSQPDAGSSVDSGDLIKIEPAEVMITDIPTLCTGRRGRSDSVHDHAMSLPKPEDRPHRDVPTEVDTSRTAEDVTLPEIPTDILMSSSRPNDVLSSVTTQSINTEDESENPLEANQSANPIKREDTVPSTPRRRATGTRSSFFATPSRKKTPSVPAQCVPLARLTSPKFGLIQEEFSHDPFRLLVAVTLLNRTRGAQAIPVFRSLLDAFPTIRSFASATPSEVTEHIKRLGFQNQRATTIVQLAQAWLATPPHASSRTRTLNYPFPGDGRDIQADEVLSFDDPRSGAFEVAHLPGVGPYALDSWRIFCRDELRGLANGWNGEDAHPDFEPEWKRVVPSDKELRAFLRWCWLREGWDWDPVTGEKEVAEGELMDMVERGEGVWLETGGQNAGPKVAGIKYRMSDISVEAADENTAAQIAALLDKR